MRPGASIRSGARAPSPGCGIRRGGGTSFIDLLQKIADLDASVAVILTDLDGDFGQRPALPVVWAVPDPRAAEPPFGTVLSLDR